jgi:hypothetical protein
MKSRKHTPLTSGAEEGLYGAAYAAKKAGKKPPKYVPKSIMKISEDVLAMHLHEAKGKKLPKHVHGSGLFMDKDFEKGYKRV